MGPVEGSSGELDTTTDTLEDGRPGSLAWAVSRAHKHGLLSEEETTVLFFERALELLAPNVKVERLRLVEEHGSRVGTEIWSRRHGLPWSADTDADGPDSHLGFSPYPDDVPASTTMKHAEWLIQWHFNGLSVSEVLAWELGKKPAIRDHVVDYEAVQKGIDRFAKKIGLTRRPPSKGGRPRSRGSM